VADVNGDGKLDALVATIDGYSVLLGNGDGTFQAASNYSLSGGGAGSVAVTDLDGDSKPDLILSSQGGVAVLLGNGDGTFGTPNWHYTGGKAGAIVVADMNRDGNPDLVVDDTYVQVPVNSGAVTVLIGNGAGGFSGGGGTGSGGFNGGSIAVGDLNGDGYPDVVAANVCATNNCRNSTLGVLLSNGDGGLSGPTIYGSGGFAAESVAIADINGDGIPDVLVVNICNEEFDCNFTDVALFLGNGDGTFTYSNRYNTGLLAANSVSIAVGDVNGDGIPDVFIATDGGLSVLLSRARTTTSLTSDPNPSIAGEDVTFKAKVTSTGRDAPTGEVVFKNGDAWIGAATIRGSAATLTKKNLPTGDLFITATYKGDTRSLESDSSALTQVVNPPSP
jgi:Big-like domain-containing protein/VCBS repeat protein